MSPLASRRAIGLVPVICLVSLLSALAAPVAELPVARWQGRTMGSPYTVQLVGVELSDPQVHDIQNEIEQRLREVNRQMSHYDPESELSRFNRAPANTPFKVSTEFARVVRFILDLCRQSDGAVDPTLAPVINLWGFGEKTDRRAVPPVSELRDAMKLTGFRHLSVTPDNELVKDIPELAINLSAVAKGFGVDQIGEVLRGRGFTNFYAAIAGEVLVRGHNPRRTRWQIGISAPISHWNEDGPMAAVAALSNQALSTSGDYQKFFLDSEGRRLCHIFDATTGWPVQHNLGGVSVVATNSMTADALSTILFVLGPEKGLRFIQHVPNAAALFIVRESEGQFRQIPSSEFARLTGYRP